MRPAASSSARSGGDSTGFEDQHDIALESFMSPKLICPACDAGFTPAKDTRGKKAFCPSCGKALMVTATGMAILDDPQKSAPTPRWNPWPMVSVAAVVLLCGSVVAYFATRHSAEDQNEVAKHDSVLPPPPTTEPVKIEPPVVPPASHPAKPDKVEHKKPPNQEPVVIRPTEGPANPAPLKIREIATIKEENYLAYCLAFSPDGKKLASGGIINLPNSANDVRLWDLASRKTTKIFSGPNGVVQSVAFSPDGKTLGSGGYSDNRSTSAGHVFLWDTTTHERINTFTTPAPSTLVAFSRDSRLFASANMTDSVQYWDVNTGQGTTLKGISPAMAFSPDSQTLASIYSDLAQKTSSLKLWNLADGRNAATFPTPTYYSYASCAAFGSNGKTVTVAGLEAKPDGRIVVGVFDVAGVEQVKTFTINDANPREFNRDGNILATGTSGIKLWDIATGKEIGELGHTQNVQAIAFNRDGTHIATATNDSTIHIWELTGGNGKHEPK
jgi:hypothetical protein